MVELLKRRQPHTLASARTRWERCRTRPLTAAQIEAEDTARVGSCDTGRT